MEIVWKCSNYYLCFVHSSITTPFEIMAPYPFQYWFLGFPKGNLGVGAEHCSQIGSVRRSAKPFSLHG